MRTTEELARECRTTKVFSEARAILDWSISTNTTAEWIVSHECIRRDLEKTTKQRDALQIQVADLTTELNKMRLDLKDKQKEAVTK